ncbi:uncharacterized protein LOC100174822 [Bombyx mori]|uniref:Uncharacterized protein n=1 Tax=Bombyx mori TaxID=7091 RepID=B3GQB7_BOMMO|nr:uncharacterized protein LOC100174822 [Bombyx mori]ACD93219.1 hypothetical protein [Bombyx mori]
MLSKTILSKNRRTKSKLSKNLERLFKEGKCRECSVVVTRMDFARILGKFTKVKIQFQSSSSTVKGKSTNPNLKSKLKSNENGFVRNEDYPTKESSKGKKINQSTNSKAANILKENNRLKESLIKDRNSNYNNITNNIKIKHYHVVFSTPGNSDNSDSKPNTTLAELLLQIDENLLPSDEWSIDYNPKPALEEPTDDKVYDRIAAELEDLMNNGKTTLKTEEKSDEFPSIMDILNDKTVNSKEIEKSDIPDAKTNLGSSDVEAILLGEPTSGREITESTPMEVENNDVSNLIADVAQLNTLQPSEEPINNVQANENSDIVNPHSPSILDEALQKGIEEHLPPEPQTITNDTELTKNHDKENAVIPEKPNDQQYLNNEPVTNNQTIYSDIKNETEKHSSKLGPSEDLSINSKLSANADLITEVIFKKNKDGGCCKSVTCQKNLMYFIQINGTSVELVGAPKFITNLDDLQILLQIVNESELKSFHVLQ